MSSHPGTQVEVATPDGPMPAQLWLPPGGSGPGVLLLQEIFGVSPYIQRRAGDLAAAGYAVLAPELYWRVDPAPITESADGALQAAMDRVTRLDWPTTVSDAVAALEDLRARPQVRGGVAALGFCFGGGLAFNVAAVAPVQALVSYYGSALPGLLDLAPAVTAPSLHHVGTADQYLDASAVQAIRAAVTGTQNPAELVTYEGADHAFDNDDFVLHHPQASELAWTRTLEFLGRHLPVG